MRALSTAIRHAISPLASLLVLALTLASPAVAADFTISDFTPADGATVSAGQEVVVSAFIVTDGEIALVNGQPDVQVTIDGAPVSAQFVVGSKAERVGFRVTRAFAAGNHTVGVTARSISGAMKSASWSFASAAPALTATLPTPRSLPDTGDARFTDSLAGLVALGLTLALLGLGLRLRVS